jgi:hypothetical protein
VRATTRLYLQDDHCFEADATVVAVRERCPNTSWTENITDMTFTSAVITVEQPSGTTVLTVSCAISPPTSDGAVPAQTVTCVAS